MDDISLSSLEKDELVANIISLNLLLLLARLSYASSTQLIARAARQREHTINLEILCFLWQN